VGISNIGSGIQAGVCTSTTRPQAPYEGQVIYETDTNRVLVWDASAWVAPNSTTANPTGLELVTSCTATFTGGTAGSVSDGVVTIGSANTAVTVSNAFSAEYNNYKIILSGGLGSQNLSLNFQLRNSSGTSVTGYYAGRVRVNLVDNTVTGTCDINATLWTDVGRAGSAAGGQLLTTDLFSPFLATQTSMAAQGLTYNTGGIVNPAMTGFHTPTTSYTDFVISVSSGNITGGTIRVYGYRN